MAGDTRIVPQGMSSPGHLALSQQKSRGPMFGEKFSAAVNAFVYSTANQMIIDSALVAMALCAAYVFRFDGQLPSPYHRQLVLLLPFAVALHLAVNVLSGM